MTITHSSYDSFLARVQSLMANDQLVDAWEALVQYGSLYEDHRCEIDYLRMCVTSRMNKPELSAHILETALSAGVWYSDDLLLESSDLEALRQQPEFDTLLTRSHQLMDEEIKTFAELFIREPQMGSDYLPLLMAMHDDNASARKQHHVWLELAEHGFLLAFPQAAHGITRGRYRWGDPTESAEVFQDHLERLNRAYWVDMERIILGGLGRGGQMAVSATLARAVPARGFIAIKPEITPEITGTWLEQLAFPADAPVRGVILEEGAGEGARAHLLAQFTEKAADFGFQCRVVTPSDQDEAFTAFVSGELPTAVDFILKG